MAAASARAYENDRVPSTVIALSTSNQPFLAPGTRQPRLRHRHGRATSTCTTSAVIAATAPIPASRPIPVALYTTPGEAIFSTLGFKPLETLKEDDYSYTFGAKGDLGGWMWDSGRHLRQGSQQDRHLAIRQYLAVHRHPLLAQRIL